MKKQLSVFLYGYYGVSNLGDDLLVHTIVSKLNQSGKIQNYYVRNVGEINALREFESVILTHQEGKLLGCSSISDKLKVLIDYTVSHWKILRKSQAFILGGGTLISNHMSTISLFLLATLVSIANINKIKIYGLGLGIGKVENKLGGLLTKYILNSMTVVCVRDNLSLEYGQQMAAKANFQLTADLVFSSSLVNTFSQTKKGPNQTKKTIGITLAAPFLSDSTENKQRILLALAECCAHWSEKAYTIKLLCFQDANLPGNIRISDKIFFNELLSISHSNTMEIIDVSSDVDHLCEIYSSLDIVVGMRFHGVVLAALASIPFVGFSSDKKVSEICNSYYMPFMDINELTTEKLSSSVSTALNLTVSPLITKHLIDDANKNFTHFFDNFPVNPS